MEEREYLEDLYLPLGINLAGQMEVSLDAGSPAILADYLQWQQARLVSRGMTTTEALQVLKQEGASLLKGMGKSESSSAQEFFNEAVRQMEKTKDKSPAARDNDLGEAAADYMRLLLSWDRFGASKMIMELANTGTPVKDIYTIIFQHALYEVGRLWQTNQVTIAQEHFFTAATQMIMSQLYPYTFNTARIGKRLVAASVDTNLHDIGIRFVADFFEMAGWDTYYLGGNTPPEVIITALSQHQPHLLALSATISQQVSIIQTTIQRIREMTEFNALKIIVGGHPFNIGPDLWQKVGSDGSVRSAEQAVALAEQLTGAPNGSPS